MAFFVHDDFGDKCLITEFSSGSFQAIIHRFSEPITWKRLNENPLKAFLVHVV
jgi:hypothetical protein